MWPCWNRTSQSRRKTRCSCERELRQRLPTRQALFFCAARKGHGFAVGMRSHVPGGSPGDAGFPQECTPHFSFSRKRETGRARSKEKTLVPAKWPLAIWPAKTRVFRDGAAGAALRWPLDGLLPGAPDIGGTEMVFRRKLLAWVPLSWVRDGWTCFFYLLPLLWWLLRDGRIWNPPLRPSSYVPRPLSRTPSAPSEARRGWSRL
jgi:hypothetical protein